MKTKGFYCLTLVTILAGMLFSCSKDTKFNGNNNAALFNTDIQLQASDEVHISNELDAAFNDINTALADTSRTAVCGAVVTRIPGDTAGVVPDITTISYTTYFTCDNIRYRTGAINILSYPPGANWNAPNTSVSIAFINYQVTRLADKSNLIFSTNGAATVTYTNVSGGSLSSLTSGSGNHITHNITGVNLNVKFKDSLNDSTIINWQITRQRVYSYNNGLQIATSGFGVDTADGYQDVSEYGSTRLGNSFALSVPPSTPLVISQSCGWQIMSGQATLYNPVGVTIMTLGLDTAGKATGCPVNGGHYFMNLSWTGEGESPYTGRIPYYY